MLGGPFYVISCWLAVSYVHRIMQLVCGAHTAISINGIVGPCLKNDRGLR